MHPARVDLPWDELEGRVFIALPRRRTRIERLLARLVRVPQNTLLTFEGDAAAFWRLADGTRTLEAIAREMAVEPARVTRFAKSMAHRGLILLQPAPTRAPDTRRGLSAERGFHRHTCRACRMLVPVRAPPGALFLCPRCKRPNRLRGPGARGPSAN